MVPAIGEHLIFQKPLCSLKDYLAFCFANVIDNHLDFINFLPLTLALSPGSNVTLLHWDFFVIKSFIYKYGWEDLISSPNTAFFSLFPPPHPNDHKYYISFLCCSLYFSINHYCLDTKKKSENISGSENSLGIFIQ